MCTVTTLPRVKHLLPAAIFRIMQNVVALLQVGVHLQHKLVAFGANIDKLLIEGILKLVDAVCIGFDAGFGEVVTGFNWGHL